ncbi:HipA domain-containing protein [Demequina sp.]|uniref:type II toxin-antitoxin system HipA family toxin n=1 Tax=Demequina sp. TaxID=2050685 RepID=UPI0025BBE624|nr:HipA domain-containing protein [Demequina sp.]
MSAVPVGAEPPRPPALEDLKTLPRAAVLQQGALAGHLTRNSHGGVDFAYTQDWVDSGRAPIATTLPVTVAPVVTAAGALPPFFSGLLPEGRRLSALRRATKTSPDDELTLLLAVGADTVGDVQVVADALGDTRVEPHLSVGDFATVRFADIRQHLDIQVDRVALPGVQDKVSARMINVPVTAAGATVLLKLNPPEFKHLIANEAFFLNAARLAGIRTVDARLVYDAVGEPGLVVTRFDRVPGTPPGARAVEDGCQVLGVYPSAKYAVTTEAVLGKLASLCEAPVPAAAEFLAQAAFAYLTGNGDAHAKNFSIFQDETGRWKPTPAYDLPSSQPYGDTTLALSVNGRRDGNISGADFVALAEHLRVRPRAARAVIGRVADSADAWVGELGELPFDRGIVHKLARVIRHRQELLRLG